MRFSVVRSLLSLTFLAIVLPASAQRNVSGAAELELSLKRLNVAGKVLMIAAHPDDENTALLAYFARGRCLDTAYLSLTRGEGGQNLIGPEQGALLGLIRTEELLAARRVDGASQFFSRAIDFGYSKTADETLRKWGREKILSDIVWVIRRFRPDIVILRFSGTPMDGHGQHQSSAMLGKEAFTAAGDPKRFPEQLQWVEPWQARHLYFNVFSWSKEQEEQAARNPAHLMIDTGEYNPILGYSYAEIAGMSRSQHRSQAMGASEPKGPSRNYLLPIGGEPAKTDVFEGIDTSWNRLPRGAEVGTILLQALREFDAAHPEKTIPFLLKARPLIAGIKSPLASEKLAELDETLALCTGLWLDATAGAFNVVPGETVAVHAVALNRSPYPVELLSIALEGISNSPAFEVAPTKLNYNKPFDSSVRVTIPGDQPYTEPFWLAQPREGDIYGISDQKLIGVAENPAFLRARFRIRIGDETIDYTRPVRYRHVDRTEGERTRPVVVAPAVSVKLPESSLLFPDNSEKRVEVQVHANDAGARGSVRLEAPAGWLVEPAEQAFEVSVAGEQRVLSFTVRPPSGEGHGAVRAAAKAGDREISSSMTVIQYPHIRPQTVFLPASARLEHTNVQLLARRIGYVMGAGDDVPQALRQLGAEVELLDDDQLARGDLSRFDAIVTGVRAYNVRPALEANRARLMDYVKGGGTLVVQYNVLEWQRGPNATPDPLENLGPYPFEVGRDRVSMEESPVRFTHPDSPLLARPNRINEGDFEGWVQERGLYFARQWDPKYQTLFASSDLGEAPLEGGTLYARYGRGVYVFTAYSWFRQLPAGVPGAFRVFANLLSAGKTLQ